jgi:Tol biopolymer transport system component
VHPGPIHCQDINGEDFSGHGVQYCSLSADGGPSFSADGRDLAFSGAQFDNSGARTPKLGEAIILADADGRGPRLLAVRIADAEQPAFMPDGTTLIFAGKAKRAAPYDLYTVAINGSGLKRLSRDGASEPAPCSNGSVVYVHRGDLYLRNTDGQTRRLTRHGGTLPDCSRDSRTIAFVRDRTLYTIYASGRNLRRMTPRHVIDGRPAFSPAGGLIALTTTTATRGCSSYSGDAYITYRLELINLQSRPQRSYVIDREDCAVANPEALGAVAWQPQQR